MKIAVVGYKISVPLLLIFTLLGAPLAHAAGDTEESDYEIPTLGDLKGEKKEIRKLLAELRKENREAKALIVKIKAGTTTVEEVGFDAKASCIACITDCSTLSIGLPGTGILDGAKCVKVDLFSRSKPDEFTKALAKDGLSKDQCQRAVDACGAVQAARKIKVLEKEISEREDEIAELRLDKKAVKQDIKVTRQLKDCPSCLESYYEGRGSSSLLSGSSGAGSWGGISAGLGAYSGYSGLNSGFGVNTGLLFANQCTYGVPCGSGAGVGLGLGLGLGTGYSPWGGTPWGNSFSSPYARDRKSVV
jgi:hypothetical protein